MTRVEECSLEPVLLDAAPHFRDRGIDVVRRDHRRAIHPARVGGTEVVQPVVVRPRDRRGVFGLESVGGTEHADGVDGEREQPAAREEDGDIEMLVVHRVQLRLGAPPERLGVRERGCMLGSPHIAGLLHIARPGHATAQHDARLDPQAHVAGDLIESDGRRVRVPRIDVPLPQVGRLEDVHVAVGDAKAVVHVST